MKIYTKRGDKGETTLFTGQAVSKNSHFIEALGTVDECNSAIGAALAFMPSDSKFSKIKEQLTIVQNALFDLGAALATPRNSKEKAKVKKTRFDKEEIDLIEKWIDEMEDSLPSLQNFVLPGGHPSGAMLHLARSICRRAERIVVPFSEELEVSDNVIAYLNRLSDYLFVLSRYVNHLADSPETVWQKHMMAGK